MFTIVSDSDSHRRLNETNERARKVHASFRCVSIKRKGNCTYRTSALLARQNIEEARQVPSKTVIRRREFIASKHDKKYGRGLAVRYILRSRKLPRRRRTNSSRSIHRPLCYGWLLPRPPQPHSHLSALHLRNLILVAIAVVRGDGTKASRLTVAWGLGGAWPSFSDPAWPPPGLSPGNPRSWGLPLLLVLPHARRSAQEVRGAKSSPQGEKQHSIKNGCDVLLYVYLELYRYLP